jgi:hypothetical protein
MNLWKNRAFAILLTEAAKLQQWLTTFVIMVEVLPSPSEDFYISPWTK